MSARTSVPGRPDLLERISGTAFGTYQTAVVRIAVAAIWLAVLLREYPNRHRIWGPDAPWGLAEADRALEITGGFSVFTWRSGDLWFELCYLLALAATACMLVGWRTRSVSVLFALSVMSFQHRNEYVLNAGENILRITAIYLVLTRCAEVWSIDARHRRRRQASADHTGTVLWAVLGVALLGAGFAGYATPTWLGVLGGIWALYGVLWYRRRAARGAPHPVVTRIGNLVHNAGLVLIVAQICLIYAAAGWYKVQGSQWQDGTAVYQSMSIEYLDSWPALTDLVSGNSAVVLLLTYATVMVQVAFPFSLLNRRCKNVLLVVLVAEHLGIAFFMGLVFFSLAMIAVDLIFLPTSALLWVERRVRDAWGRTRSRLPWGPGEPAAGRPFPEAGPEAPPGEAPGAGPPGRAAELPAPAAPVRPTDDVPPQRTPEPPGAPGAAGPDGDSERLP